MYPPWVVRGVMLVQMLLLPLLLLLLMLLQLMICLLRMVRLHDLIDQKIVERATILSMTTSRC